jgi:hypothetical protein
MVDEQKMRESQDIYFREFKKIEKKDVNINKVVGIYDSSNKKSLALNHLYENVNSDIMLKNIELSKLQDELNNQIDMNASQDEIQDWLLNKDLKEIQNLDTDGASTEVDTITSMKMKLNNSTHTKKKVTLKIHKL